MIPTVRLDPSLAARVLAAAALCIAAPAAIAAPPKTATLRIGGHALKVEVVSTDEERMKGLMFREKLGKNDGMLFIFDEPAYHAMWMKNTLIPLSVAFVTREGVILNILDMEPKSLDSHQSAGPSVYAIETNKGWFAERRIKAGDAVSGLPRPAK